MTNAENIGAPAAKAVQKKAKSSSFYIAMRLMPAEERDAMFAIYAFCRKVDDIADDGVGTRAERHEKLEKWRADLRGEEIDGGKGSVSGQGRKKRERQPPHGGAKFVVATAVPGDDPVKLGQAGERAWRSLNSHHIQAGRRYTFDAISKPNERLHGAGHPDFGVLGAQMLQGREADDAVANGSRPDQKRLQRKSTAMRKSTVFGGKHMVSEQA